MTAEKDYAFGESLGLEPAVIGNQYVYVFKTSMLYLPLQIDLCIYRKCALEIEPGEGSLGQLFFAQWLDSSNEVFVPDFPRLRGHDTCILQWPIRHQYRQPKTAQDGLPISR